MFEVSHTFRLLDLRISTLISWCTVFRFGFFLLWVRARGGHYFYYYIWFGAFFLSNCNSGLLPPPSFYTSLDPALTLYLLLLDTYFYILHCILKYLPTSSASSSSRSLQFTFAGCFACCDVFGLSVV
ncbi:hypothetical protein BJ508DRAFT_101797 [Ascobolus immersus RN42]|uniref:Uncharacterized protein n=1 Tax=Ascobolus immersus RN42 TaxID=1160509 RepID=A0A3N4H9D2_ASCIM|nr:hypothetical protein BJ508DRAFT_101797 [Ascobolus immersus RN42]